MFSWFFLSSALAGVLCTSAEDATGLVINEFLPDPSGADAGEEWVELYNATHRPIELHGYTIAAGTAALTDSDPFPAHVVAVDRFLVIGPVPRPATDLIVSGFTLGNAGTSADAVQLRDCHGDVVDTVVYGAPNTDLFDDDHGTTAVSLAPAARPGESVARVMDGMDTDDGAVDFEVAAPPTPGASNAAAEACDVAPGIVINELLPNPSGADDGHEWVELFHGGGVAVELTGWVLESGTTSWSEAIALGGTIDPGGHRLVGGAEVALADHTGPLTLGNASSSADAVRLVDCVGTVVDTVVYGTPNDGDAPFEDETGTVATRLAPAPGEDEALQRLEDGYDTDDNLHDFIVTSQPSPGAPNPVVEPVACAPSSGRVVINEVLPDPAGEDAGAEFVELYNTGPGAARLDGWSLSAGTQHFDGRDVRFGTDTEVPAAGFLVVGGQDVAAVDVVAAWSLGNGTGADGVRLFDCEDRVVDTVIYGGPANDDGIPDDRGEIVEPYGEPGSDESIARAVDGSDTDAAADWRVRPRPSPGMSNQVDPPDRASIADPLRGRGCARPGDPPTGPAVPSSGCVAGTPVARHLGWAWLVWFAATCWRARDRR